MFYVKLDKMKDLIDRLNVIVLRNAFVMNGDLYKHE